MKPSRRLTLRAEVLSELTGEQLGEVAAAAPLTPQCATTPLDICVPTVMPDICLPSFPLVQCAVSWPC